MGQVYLYLTLNGNQPHTMEDVVQTLTDVAAWRPIFSGFAPRVGGVLKLIVTAHRVLPVNNRCMTQIANRQNLPEQINNECICHGKITSHRCAMVRFFHRKLIFH